MAFDNEGFNWGVYWDKNKKAIKNTISAVCLVGGALYIGISMAISPTLHDPAIVLTTALGGGTTFGLSVKVALDKIDYGFTEEPK